ncbi:MAG: enoyl-CoA hydratase/isomerase family protein [Proteobacteria bacterium]|nr:enoyl-CoA hydratase/isomerase family protein [Pseudomonadota bacterium]
MDRVVAAPVAGGDFAADVAAFAAYWRGNPGKQAGRDARYAFLRRHARALYDKLTDNRRKFVRIERLAYEAPNLVPGLVPTKAEVDGESGKRQADKDGVEIDQGILFNQFLADPECGRHLVHAMLLPREESAEALAKFRRDGKLDLGTARVERHGKAAVLLLSNKRFLNAEDNFTQTATEIGADVCILDPDSQVAVLRGDVVPEGKYAGRRVFNAGINLTHIYYGKIPFLWFLIRDMGFVNKMFRGLARSDVSPDEVSGDSIEKLWIAAVETFAIGGGCQILLATDFNIAASDAYMTLPARKEGIIPAMANLRMARFTGDRIARQAIMYERRIDCDSDAGRLVCDEIVPPQEMDGAIERVIEHLTTSGSVGAIGNRRALRLAAEPFDLFRQYAALYAREQALCHFSPALISNLEKFWNAQSRKA